jgi:hypothetical protein
MRRRSGAGFQSRDFQLGPDSLLHEGVPKGQLRQRRNCTLPESWANRLQTGNSKAAPPGTNSEWRVTFPYAPIWLGWIGHTGVLLGPVYTEWPLNCQTVHEENIVYRYFKVIVLSAALVVPVLVSAQDRDHQDKDQHNQQSRRYEDKTHKDSHEWNTNEDQAYRRYLQEHHKRYHDFSKAKKSEQNDYWNWRHSHSDNDRR